MAGHIEKTKNGTYKIVLELGIDAQGKRIRKKVTYKTSLEAKRALNEYENQMNKGTFVIPDDLRFGDWIKYWEENYAKNECEENTYKEYCRNDKKYIIPCLGHIPLQKLNQNNLDDYYKYLYDKDKGPGLSVSTIEKHHANISSALRFAMKKGKVFQNVASLATLPKATKDEKFEGTSYNALQAKKLLDLYKDTDIEIAVAISIFLGLSRGEICALKKDRIFLFKGSTRKDYLLIEETRVKSDTKVITKDPKSISRKRALYIPRVLKKYIITQFKWIRKNKKIYDDKFIDSNYICVLENGKEYHPQYISRKFKKILDNYNDKSEDNEKLPYIRFHDLRHTNITVLIEDDANIYDVSKHAGHSNINTTMGYTHKFDENQKKLANRIDDIFKK